MIGYHMCKSMGKAVVSSVVAAYYKGTLQIQIQIYRIYSNKRPWSVKFSSRGMFIRVKFTDMESYLNISIPFSIQHIDTGLKIVRQKMSVQRGPSSL